MSTPVVTRADIQQRLTSPGEDSVLYLKTGLDDERGPLEADVWVSAYVPPGQPSLPGCEKQPFFNQNEVAGTERQADLVASPLLPRRG